MLLLYCCFTTYIPGLTPTPVCAACTARGRGLRAHPAEHRLHSRARLLFPHLAPDLAIDSAVAQYDIHPTALHVLIVEDREYMRSTLGELARTAAPNVTLYFAATRAAALGPYRCPGGGRFARGHRASRLDRAGFRGVGAWSRPQAGQPLQRHAQQAAHRYVVGLSSPAAAKTSTKKASTPSWPSHSTPHRSTCYSTLPLLTRQSRVPLD